MTDRRRPAAARVAVVLAVISVLTTLGAGVAAGVVMMRDDPADGSGTLVRGSGDAPDEAAEGTTAPTPESVEATTYDYTGWQVVKGRKRAAQASASYRVPGADWRVAPRNRVMKLAGPDHVDLIGYGRATYDGNGCRESGRGMPAGWSVLDEVDPYESSTKRALRDVANDAAGDWAHAYAGAAGAEEPSLQPITESITLPDGTTAVRATITLDLSGASGSCTSGSAELMVTSINTSDGRKSLVQARMLLANNGISDSDWEAISQSLER